MQLDNHDLIELNALGEELKSKHNQLSEKIMLLTTASCEVLKLKAAVEIFKDAKKDLEEIIRIKKLSITIKPR